MPDRYAPALLLDVCAFWFVLRWLLPRRGVEFVGRVLVLVMAVGVLGTLDEHHYLWALCFAASGLLAWVLLRRWQRAPTLRRFGLPRPGSRAWRDISPDELATLCERRIGLHVDAAVSASVTASPPWHCVLALAGNGVWMLEDGSATRRARIGRVLACWDRKGWVAHVEHSRRGERFEFSWPRNGSLVRGVIPPGPAAELVEGHLVADELAP